MFGSEDEEDKIIWNVQCHYAQAKIDNCIFSLGDCAYIMVKNFYFIFYLLNSAFVSLFSFVVTTNYHFAHCLNMILFFDQKKKKKCATS